MKFVFLITFQKYMGIVGTKILTILQMVQLFIMIMAHGILKFVFLPKKSLLEPR